jgi:hypothetical protein
MSRRRDWTSLRIHRNTSWQWWRFDPKGVFDSRIFHWGEWLTTSSTCRARRTRPLSFVTNVIANAWGSLAIIYEKSQSDRADLFKKDLLYRWRSSNEHSVRPVDNRRTPQRHISVPPRKETENATDAIRQNILLVGPFVQFASSSCPRNCPCPRSMSSNIISHREDMLRKIYLRQSRIPYSTHHRCRHFLVSNGLRQCRIRCPRRFRK